MNSPPKKDVEQNGLSKEAPKNPNEDRNANLHLDESKGAIPKTKTTKPTKKSQKSNNNLEEVDLFKRNGYEKLGGSYLNNFVDSDDELNCKLDMGHDSNTKLLNIPPEEDFLSSYADRNLEIKDQLNLQLNDSSSDDNELLSMSDDGCIYTYKGDQVADLPRSFYNLELPLLENLHLNEGSREENSSPEMDYLEMDFDPGPSGDADSDSLSHQEVEDIATRLQLNYNLNKREQEEEEEEAPILAEPEPKPCCSKYITESRKDEASCITPIASPVAKNETIMRIPQILNEVKMPWSCTLNERTKCGKTLRITKRAHTAKAELLSPNGENCDFSTCNLNFDGKILIDDKNSINEEMEKVMIWTEQEACVKQINQIGPSMCGTAAVLNVLNALRLPIPTLDKVNECVTTRIRSNFASLPEYLLTSSRAGCTHRDIIRGLHRVSQGRIYSRFFAMYPERIVNLQSWLGYWIKNGAVPIATLNLQVCDGLVPDSWHTQMIFGVGPKGIYLTNPLELVDAKQLFPQLSSDSILLVKTEDVISRWNGKSDLPELMKIQDVRWKEFNVVGQVAKVIREYRRSSKITSHIQIPAEYRAGITIAIDSNSPAFSMLCQCPELPILELEDTASAFE